MSFIILKHIISRETTFLEFTDFSLGVLILYLCRSDPLDELTDQFLHSHKLSFNPFSLVFF